MFLAFSAKVDRKSGPIYSVIIGFFVMEDEIHNIYLSFSFNGVCQMSKQVWYTLLSAPLGNASEKCWQS